MRVNHLKSNQIDIDEKKALRYLRYKGTHIDKKTSKSIKESITELKRLVKLNTYIPPYIKQRIIL